MADGFERQFGQPLLDLAALDLEQAGFGSRPLARIRAGKAAKFREFQRGQIDLQLRELALEEGVGDQRLVAVEFGTGDVLHLLDPALRRRDPGNAGAFVREQEFRSEEHTSELQSLMRISYAVFCLKKKTN